jgi:hypothetical protein
MKREERLCVRGVGGESERTRNSQLSQQCERTPGMLYAAWWGGEHPGMYTRIGMFPGERMRTG